MFFRQPPLQRAFAHHQALGDFVAQRLTLRQQAGQQALYLRREAGTGARSGIGIGIGAGARLFCLLEARQHAQGPVALRLRQFGDHAQRPIRRRRLRNRNQHPQIGIGELHRVGRHAEQHRASKRVDVRLRRGRLRAGVGDQHRAEVIVFGGPAQGAQQHAPQKVIALLRHCALPARLVQDHACALVGLVDAAMERRRHQRRIAHQVLDGGLDVGRYQDDVTHHSQTAEQLRRRDLQSEQGIIRDVYQKLPHMAELVRQRRDIACDAIALIQLRLLEQCVDVEPIGC